MELIEYDILPWGSSPEVIREMSQCRFFVKKGIGSLSIVSSQLYYPMNFSQI
jgi:hypothetical protein